jgi:hypothetical protein
MLRTSGTRTDSESTLPVAGLSGYPMFVGMDAHPEAGLEVLDCQEGSGRLGRFRGAGSLLYHHSDHVWEP